ncbi:hypothetical protein K435DRAFT_814066, partial [Dendrothele bispora CBS 962.96]
NAKSGIGTFQTPRESHERWSKISGIADRKWNQEQRPSPKTCVHLINSYRLETLEGTPINGLFSARRLREFVPRPSTKLFKDQKTFEELLSKEDGSDGDSGHMGKGTDEIDDVAEDLDEEGSREDIFDDVS